MAVILPYWPLNFNQIVLGFIICRIGFRDSFRFGDFFQLAISEVVHSLPSNIAFLRERLFCFVKILSRRVCIFTAEVSFCGLGFM